MKPGGKVQKFLHFILAIGICLRTAFSLWGNRIGGLDDGQTLYSHVKL
jgi:hypothetical protein